MWGFLIRTAVRTAIRSGQQPARTGPPRGAAVGPPRVAIGAPPKRRPQVAGGLVLLSILASCWLTAGLMSIAGGAMNAVHPTPEHPLAQSLQGMIGAFVICVMPSVVLLGISAWSVWTTRRMDRLVALAETHARLPLDVAAQELGTSRETVRSMLLTAVSKQYVRGRLDLDHGVFFSGDAEVAARQWAGHCPSCSAPVSITLARGEAGICPFCRAPLGVWG